MFGAPFPFLDSDVYKWLEAAGWELGRADSDELRSQADLAIDLVAKAQRPDGYLNTFVQVLAPGTEYRDLKWGHELYCVGHLIQAAVAWKRAVGDDRLLEIASRAAAHAEAALGPGAREAVDGHPEIEMALVELYRTTGERRHLETAAAFLDRRGHGLLGSDRFGAAYWQDHATVRDAPTVAGHAVRQLYLDCGAVDVATELGDDGAARRGPPPLGRPARDPDVPDRRRRQPASGRVVRRPVRAAAGPGLHRDLRRDRQRDARLAAAARAPATRAPRT